MKIRPISNVSVEWMLVTKIFISGVFIIMLSIVQINTTRCRTFKKSLLKLCPFKFGLHKWRSKTFVIFVYKTSRDLPSKIQLFSRKCFISLKWIIPRGMMNYELAICPQFSWNGPAKPFSLAAIDFREKMSVQIISNAHLQQEKEEGCIDPIWAAWLFTCIFNPVCENKFGTTSIAIFEWTFRNSKEAAISHLKITRKLYECMENEF